MILPDKNYEAEKISLLFKGRVNIQKNKLILIKSNSASLYLSTNILILDFCQKILVTDACLFAVVFFFFFFFFFYTMDDLTELIV